MDLVLEDWFVVHVLASAGYNCCQSKTLLKNWYRCYVALSKNSCPSHPSCTALIAYQLSCEIGNKQYSVFMIVCTVVSAMQPGESVCAPEEGAYA